MKEAVVVPAIKFSQSVKTVINLSLLLQTRNQRIDLTRGKRIDDIDPSRFERTVPVHRANSRPTTARDLASIFQSRQNFV